MVISKVEGIVECDSDDIAVGILGWMDPAALDDSIENDSGDMIVDDIGY